MNTLEKNIDVARYSFEMETGKPVTKLYLGWETYRDLMQKLQHMPTFKVDIRDVVRAEYMGMKIYRVDEKQYLSVGI